MIKDLIKIIQGNPMNIISKVMTSRTELTISVTNSPEKQVTSQRYLMSSIKMN